jgi:putative ABC transport system permease protein
MRALLLARRSLAHHRGRTAILLACIALTLLLPFAVEGLVAVFGRSLRARAVDTPLVVGAKGSRFDLVLNTLYFRGRVPEALPMRELEQVRADGLALPIPVLARNTAGGGWPLVGTTPDYFRFRGLRPASGELPLLLGECVLGARVAARQGLAAGDRLLTDRRNLYALEAGYPLRMQVVGVLAPTGGPDDAAVFASLQTVWVAEGIGHGHGDAREQDPERVIAAGGERGVVLDAGVREFQEITPENAKSFHFHEEPGALPLTAIVALPRDPKAGAILRGRYQVAEHAQILVPREVIDEIAEFVLRLKAFFDANVLLVGVSTALFFGLVVLLTVRLRRQEIETLTRIGASRAAVFRMFVVEFGLVVAVGAALAAVLAGLGLWLFQEWLPWL